MREFAAAGGEMIIYGAHYAKNTQAPEKIISKIS